MFEGQDYSKVSAESDKQTFDQLLAKRVEELQCGPRERVLRSENKASSRVGLEGATGTSVCIHVCVQRCGVHCSPLHFPVILSLQSVLTVDLPSTSRKRRTLSPEELEERRRKVSRVALGELVEDVTLLYLAGCAASRGKG